MKHLIVTLAALLTVMAAFSDRKMTVRNADTGESFDIEMADGLQISEVNPEWLDSVPYLLEHAREGELWARKAIAECYRYGKGGLKQSFFNTMFYSELAGMREEDLFEEFRDTTQVDPFLLVIDMIGDLDRGDNVKALHEIDILNGMGYHSADILREVIEGRKTFATFDELIDYATAEDTDPDAAIYAFGYYMDHHPQTKIDSEKEARFYPVMKKVPGLLMVLGEKRYSETLEPVASEESDASEGRNATEDEAKRRKAVEYLLKADEYGLLSPAGARIIDHYLTNDLTSDWLQLSDADLARIRRLASLPG